MIRNYYYLIVGILCILFAVTHTLNGIITTLPILSESDIANSSKVPFVYNWHIIGIENFIFGIALILMAFSKHLSKVKFLAWFLILILIFRWTVITYFTISNSNENFEQLIPDTIAIFLVVILLILGTKIKERRSNE